MQSMLKIGLLNFTALGNINWDSYNGVEDSSPLQYDFVYTGI